MLVLSLYLQLSLTNYFFVFMSTGYKIDEKDLYLKGALQTPTFSNGFRKSRLTVQRHIQANGGS